MAQLLQILKTHTQLKSPQGAQLAAIQSPVLLVMSNVVAVAVQLSRDKDDPSVVRAMSMIVTTASGEAVPISRIADMENAAKVTAFQDYAKEVLGQLCGPDELVTVEAKDF